LTAITINWLGNQVSITQIPSPTSRYNYLYVVNAAEKHIRRIRYQASLTPTPLQITHIKSTQPRGTSAQKPGRGSATSQVKRLRSSTEQVHPDATWPLPSATQTERRCFYEAKPPPFRSRENPVKVIVLKPHRKWFTSCRRGMVDT